MFRTIASVLSRGLGRRGICIGSTLPPLPTIGGVLIYALDGAEQLEGYAADDWVISDLVRMECLAGPLHTADQMRLLAIRSFSCIRSRWSSCRNWL